MLLKHFDIHVPLAADERIGLGALDPSVKFDYDESSDGGVPVLEISFEKKDESSFGELCWFFFAACGVSAYMLGVNPFDQPGVEAYKKNMFALLGKPGYEDLRASIEERIK